MQFYISTVVCNLISSVESSPPTSDVASLGAIFSLSFQILDLVCVYGIIFMFLSGIVSVTWSLLSNPHAFLSLILVFCHKTEHCHRWLCPLLCDVTFQVKRWFFLRCVFCDIFFVWFCGFILSKLIYTLTLITTDCWYHL